MTNANTYLNSGEPTWGVEPWAKTVVLNVEPL